MSGYLTSYQVMRNLSILMRVVTLSEPHDAAQPLFIEFVNTLHWDEGAPIELIGDQAGLADWLSEHSLPDIAHEATLPALWSFREHARAITRALVVGQPLPEADVEALKHALAEPGGRLVLVEHDDRRPELAFQVPDDGGSVVTFQIALSLANFLAAGERQRLKLCANPGCGFAFLDTSTNRTRRWCYMQYCGNRLKARAFRRRRKMQEARVEGPVSRRTDPSRPPA
jgi:predicted RNA-binding Zn ribbon-like protein